MARAVHRPDVNSYLTRIVALEIERTCAYPNRDLQGANPQLPTRGRLEGPPIDEKRGEGAWYELNSFTSFREVLGSTLRSFLERSKQTDHLQASCIV